MSGINDVNNYLDHIFDPIDSNIKLDDEQKASVLGDEQYSLVVAGAGTGKTTTVAAKVKYLVDVKNVNPSKILVMSYTRKAVEELRRRINVDLDVPACITTFHSLGLRYLRLINDDKKIVPIDSNERRSYFLDYFKSVFSSKEKLNEFVSLFNDNQISWIDPRSFTYGQFFRENYKDFDSFDDYFKAYVQKKILETEDIERRVNYIAFTRVNDERPTTIKGERVKSKGEAIIANFLYRNGVDYEYERVYEELVGERQAYRPDFSIDVGGEKIYIEYFGMSGNNYDNHSYERIRKLKEEYHKKKNNRFIALEYAPKKGYLRKLRTELAKLDVKLKPRPIEEVYRLILEQNPLAELFHLENFFYSIISTIKTSEKIKSFEEYKALCNSVIKNKAFSEDKAIKERQLWWIEDFWNYYQSMKSKDDKCFKVDYADMIREPQGKVNTIIPSKLNFDYIIVDEYQDISAERFNLLKETIEACNAKFMAIGDDWQSIFAFQGAKVGYIMNFDDYFPHSKRYIISRTYRNAQSLIDAAGTFVMQNQSQIKKDLKSNKDLSQPICFVKIKNSLFANGSYVDDRNRTVEAMIRHIHEAHPEDSVCVIGRTNNMIESLFKNPHFINSAESKIRIEGIDDFYFDAMTIHKSKGLTYDWTIVMPLTKYFPSDPKKVFWALDIVRNEPEAESVPYAEQRRLLYVALTRTKNRVYILMPQRGEHSIYKDELNTIIQDLKTQRDKILPES